MSIRRIVPNITSDKIEESKAFYRDFLGLTLAMDMGWILTFVSPDNKTAQVSVVKGIPAGSDNLDITLSIEVDQIDSLYENAQRLKYPIPYPITTEPWGVRRFIVKDPNGVTINIMTHAS